MHPRYPMMQPHFFTAFSVVHWIFGLIVLAGWVFFLVTAWRFMRAHESLAGAMTVLKDNSISVKPKE